jgi:hypothetical protein
MIILRRELKTIDKWAKGVFVEVADGSHVVVFDEKGNLQGDSLKLSDVRPTDLFVNVVSGITFKIVQPRGTSGVFPHVIYGRIENENNI